MRLSDDFSGLGSKDAREAAANQLKAFAGRPIVFYPAFSEIAGSVEAGIFLSQLLYWTPKAHDEDGWVYKTQAEWREETTLHREGQERARKHLRAIDVLEEERRGVSARLYYRIDMERLSQCLDFHATKSADIPQTRMGASRNLVGGHPADYTNKTESTPETTSEIPPPTPPGGSARKKNEITDEFIDALATEFADRLGGTERVKTILAEAMNHRAMDKAKDHRLYLRGWLRRETEHSAPAAGYGRGQNGTPWRPAAVAVRDGVNTIAGRYDHLSGGKNFVSTLVDDDEEDAGPVINSNPPGQSSGAQARLG